MPLKNYFRPQDKMPATAFQRLAARAIDAVVVLFILFLLVITHIFWYMDELSDAHQYSPWGRSFIASVSYLGLYIIYEAVFHTYNRGQTPGKLAMNIYLTALPAATFGQDNNINNINSMKSPVDTGNIHAPRLYQSLIRIILPVTPLLFFEPWLAESLTSNEAFDVWTLTLRNDVTFGNGDQMTTTHVRDSIQRFVNPEDPNVQRNQSGAWVAFIEDYVILDDLTMEFHLNQAWSTFPFALADESGMIVNTDVVESAGGVVEFNRNPEGGGAGPYEIVRYVPQDEIVLRAKDDWWGGPVCIETLRFTRLNSADATYEAWKNDELQGAFLREPATIAEAMNDGSDNAFTFVKNLGGVVLVNNGVRGSETPTSDVRLRQAIALAIDATVVDERADKGLGFPYKSLLHPDSVFYEAELFPEIETDLEEAKRLVEEVKAEGNWDGSIRLHCYNVPSRVDWAIAVTGFLEEAGFSVELDNDGTINDMIGAVLIRADYDLACWGFNLADLEPVNSMLQHTCTAISNRTGYCNEEMDAAVNQLRTAANNQDLKDAYAEVWRVWLETMPSVPLNLIVEYVLFQDNVKGVIDSQTSIVSFHKAYIEQ